MSDYHNFTSLAPHEEAQFVVFERRTQESQQKAFMIALISGGVVLLAALGLYFGVTPHKDETSKGMDMEQLKSNKKPAAAAPTPTPAPAAPAAAPAAPPAEAPAATP